MPKSLPVSSLMAIGFGILILLMPNILAYLVAVYLILTGVMGISAKR